jgi:hypothetical protein
MTTWAEWKENVERGIDWEWSKLPHHRKRSPFYHAWFAYKKRASLYNGYVMVRIIEKITDRLY